jgi:hypothetical protein
LNAYLDAIINKDISKYEALMLSKVDVEQMVKQTKVTYSNCITDKELNYSPQPFLKQFENTDFKILNINSYKVLYSQPFQGCGKMEGLKIILTLNKNDEPIQTRTLTLLKFENTYKLVFDMSSNNN